MTQSPDPFRKDGDQPAGQQPGQYPPPAQGQQDGQQYGQPQGQQYGQPYPQQPAQQYGHPGYADPRATTYYLGYLGQEYGPYDYTALQQMASATRIKPDTTLRLADTQQYVLARDVPGVFSDKEWVTTLILSWLIGSLGIDRFYLGYTGLGILKLLTCGGFGIWAIIDAVLVTMRKIPDSQGRALR